MLDRWVIDIDLVVSVVDQSLGWTQKIPLWLVMVHQLRQEHQDTIPTDIHINRAVDAVLVSS